MHKYILLCLVLGSPLIAAVSRGASSLATLRGGQSFPQDDRVEISRKTSGVLVEKEVSSSVQTQPGKSDQREVAGLPWAVRWWKLSQVGSISQSMSGFALSHKPEHEMNFQAQIAPKSSEILFVSLFSITILGMIVAAVIWTAKASLLRARSWDEKLEKKGLSSSGSRIAYQGENENLDDELLERAWWAEEIAKLQMAKFMQEAAQRKHEYEDEPASVTSVVTSSSEEEQMDLKALSPCPAQDELPFALLMADEFRSQSPTKSGTMPEVALDDQSITQKINISKKLRHPREGRSSSGRASRQSKSAKDASRYHTS